MKTIIYLTKRHYFVISYLAVANKLLYEQEEEEEENLFAVSRQWLYMKC